MKKVAVVILNFNGQSFLEKFLPLLVERTPEWAEVIIADNCSSDHSISYINTSFPNLRQIQLDQNYGFAGGYNRALLELEFEYFLLLNSDIEVPENYLFPLTDFLDNHPEYAAVQPKILDFNRRDHFEYAGACGGFLDTFYFPYCRGRLLDNLEKDHGQYDSIINVHWATGACLLIRSSVFKENSGFDPAFFAHMEEIDLCLRIRNSGWRIACVPTSFVYHVGGGTLSKVSPFKTYLNYRNNLLLILKNERIINLLFILPLRLLLDIGASFIIWKRNSINHFLSVYKAYLDFIGKSGEAIKHRPKKITLKNKRVNLLFNYYIKGKRKFSELIVPDGVISSPHHFPEIHDKCQTQIKDNR